MPRPRTRYKNGLVWCPRCAKWLDLGRFCINKTSGRPASYCKSCQSRANVESSFGICREDYQNLHARQGGRCAICGGRESVTSAITGRRHRLAVDHNHKTGAVRGLLCRRCNAALGMLEEDAERFAVAVAYLRNGGPVLDLLKEDHRKVVSEWSRLFPTVELPHTAVARWLEVAGGDAAVILTALEETKRRVHYIGPSTVRYVTSVVASAAQRAQVPPRRKPGEKEPLTEKDRERRRKVEEYFKTHPSPWPDDDDDDWEEGAG